MKSSSIVPQVPLGESREHRFEGDEGSALNVGELLSVLRRRLWLVLLLGAAGLGGSYFLLSREPVRYRANALIRLRDAQAEVAGGVLGQAGAPTPRAGAKIDPLMSEMLVLRGRQVAGAVVDRAGLRLFDMERGMPAAMVDSVVITLAPDQSRQFGVRFESSGVVATAGTQSVRAGYGEPVSLTGLRFTVPLQPVGTTDATLALLPRETAVDWLIASVSAVPTVGTDAITVSVVSPAPTMSMRLVNTVVDEYQNANVARARELNRRRREFLEARLREADDSLVVTQTALGRFRSRTGVYSAAAQSQTELAGASGAESQRKQLAAEQRIRHAQLAELENATSPGQTDAMRALLASPEIAESPIVSQLFARMTQLGTERDNLRAAGRPRTHESVLELEKLIASTEKQLVDGIRSQLAVIDSRVNALGDVRRQATAELERITPTSSEEARLAEQLDAMRIVSTQLRAELQQVRLAEAVEMGQVEVIEPATRAIPIANNRLLKLALGLAFGLFMGTALAFIREQMNTGFHRRVDLERHLRVPGLAVIPRLEPAGKSRRLFGKADKAPRRIGGKSSTPPGGTGVVLPELVTVASMKDSAAEAYRGLRTRLLFASAGVSMRSLVVTSADVGEGKSTTAANLAVTLAQQGLRVLLVDCDLRRPRLHTVFGVSNAQGLTGMLSGQMEIDQVIHVTGVEGLSLITSGPSPSGPQGPSELLGGSTMEVFLAAMIARFDLVLLDTPPVLAAPDTSALATRAAATVMIVRAGKTRRAQAQEAVQQLRAVGANLVGAVLNDPDSKTRQYREYSYQQYGYYASA